MITKPRFVTIDTELFTNGQAAIFDAATNSFTASDDSATFHVKGDWATATDYVVNDVVLNDGSSYVCILAHTSDATNEPGVGVDTDTYWQVFSQKGDTGATGATGAAGADGADGINGADGAPGQGVPTGGTAGQVLSKIDGTNYNTEWVDPPGGGSGGASVLNDLTDVTITSATSGQILKYDGSKWVNDDEAAALALGETSSTAYRGDRGKTAYDHSQLTSGNPHSVTKSDVGLGNVTNDAQLKAADLDTDSTFAADSDTKIPSQKAVKTALSAKADVGAPRVASTTSSATPTPNADTTDHFILTAQAAAAAFANPTGTPASGQRLLIQIKDNATARALTWGTDYAARGADLPSTTTAGKWLTIGFIYNAAESTFDCVAVAEEA